MTLAFVADTTTKTPARRIHVSRKAVIIGAALGALSLAVAGGATWWSHAKQFESTDDAFIDTRIVSISPQVAGMVAKLDVTDNQLVSAGTVLARLDDASYRFQLDQANAQVSRSQADISNVDAQLDAQHSRVDAADRQVAEGQAALSFSQQEYDRYQNLEKAGSGTEQRLQQATSDLAQKKASLAAAQANLLVAQKQLKVLETQRGSLSAQLRSAQANADLAQTNLKYTEIKAPVDGRVTKLSGAAGTYLTPGQSIAMFVPDDIWVTANFKETQLDEMKPGQPVTLTVDAYPGKTFAGRVDSMQAGSGTAFSLLPAENATGNYVKVTQRVPVKIVFDQKPDVRLGPGMSVVPTVKVQ
jgi:membrane fusion protein, multidrug efflux system